MKPNDIAAIGPTLYGDLRLERSAEASRSSTSQLWRVVHESAPIIRRMQSELEKPIKRKKAKRPTELTSKGCGLSDPPVFRALR